MSAKRLHLAPIAAADSRELTRRLHYSGTVVRNGQLHLGAFLDGVCEGVMSFGPPMDKGKVIGLVRDTAWNNMLELNRLAFSEALPRNSESRALGVARKLIARHYPHIEWILSFADATQCGDGTIYRASGFDLTGIRPNNTLWMLPSGDKVAAMSLEAHWSSNRVRAICDQLGIPHIYRSRRDWQALGAFPLEGFQLRYIAFRDQSVRDRLTVPILPHSVIGETGAGMARGLSK